MGVVIGKVEQGNCGLILGQDWGDAKQEQN
jgi:hypothetical protein